MADVVAFWRKFAEEGESNTQAANLLIARAAKASAEARKPEAVAKAKATREAKKALSVERRGTSVSGDIHALKVAVAPRALKDQLHHQKAPTLGDGV